MAKLYINNNKIYKKWKLCHSTAEICFRLFYVNIGIVLSLILFLYKNSLALYWLIPQILLSVIFYLLHLTLSKQAAVLNAGVMGENATRRLIRHLPGGFYAVSNVKIEHEGSKSELDLVVVGPTGIFVIETKNYSGNILGHTADNAWRRIKKGEQGNSLSTTFYSPVKQVSTHTYRLSKFLKENKFYVWVQGMVYFSDTNASIRLKGDLKKIPVFIAEHNKSINRNKLLKYIKTFSKQKRLSAKTVDKIVRLLRNAK